MKELSETHTVWVKAALTLSITKTCAASGSASTRRSLPQAGLAAGDHGLMSPLNGSREFTKRFEEPLAVAFASSQRRRLRGQEHGTVRKMTPYEVRAQ